MPAHNPTHDRPSAPTAPRPSGRGWAYTGAILGGAVSVAANVAHSYVPPKDAPAGWTPHTGAVIGAVFWPVALFVAIEILARVAWPEQARWVALRYAGLLPVAAVAALVSYQHLAGLLAYYNYDRLTAAIGPLAVDGLMVMATGALIATSSQRTAPEPAPQVVLQPALAPAEDPECAQASDPEPASGEPAPKRPRKPALDPALVEKRNAEARAQYEVLTAAGVPVTASTLGRLFDRSESWARQRIAEAKGAGTPVELSAHNADLNGTPLVGGGDRG